MLNQYLGRRKSYSCILTLQAVSVEQVLAFFMALHTALGASHSLTSYAPQEALALVAVSRRRCRPRLEVVRRRARYRIDEALQRLLVHVHFLRRIRSVFGLHSGLPQDAIIRSERDQREKVGTPTRSSSLSVARGSTDVSPALRLVAAIVCTRSTRSEGVGH